MRRAFRAFACAVAFAAASCAPAVAAPANGQLAAVVDGQLVTLNPDGSGLRALADAQGITELAFSPGGNRLAFVKAGQIGVLELATGRVLTLTSGAVDANPGWSADGLRIGFRRGTSTLTVLAAGGEQPQPRGELASGTSDVGWAPDLAKLAPVVDNLLRLDGLDPPPPAAGAPAWAPDSSAVAFAGSDGSLSTVALGTVTRLTGGPARAPRWSPDARSLLYLAGNELRTISVPGGAVRTVLTAQQLGAADWQPCTAGVTAGCESVTPPHCGATTAATTTQADQPVDLPPPPCTDPAGRPLTLVVVRGPEHGTLGGLRYTPAPGFVGQDTISLRVSNGAVESETVRVTVFVVPRPAPTASTKPPVLVQGAPFLSARATPRLDRRRRALVKLACDQDCTLTVRLTAHLRSRRTVKGPQVTRSVVAQDVLTLRLRLPRMPRGAIKTVWITGRVRNAAGDVRTVKLPVRLPR